MSTYLYTWNAKLSVWSEQSHAITEIRDHGQYVTDWSCGKAKKIEAGDNFLLMKLGADPKGIIGCGVVNSNPIEVPHPDKSKADIGKKCLRTEMTFQVLSEEPLICLSHLREVYPDFNWTPLEGGSRIPDAVCDKLVPAIRTGTKVEVRQLSPEVFPTKPLEDKDGEILRVRVYTADGEIALNRGVALERRKNGEVTTWTVLAEGETVARQFQSPPAVLKKLKAK